MEREEGRRAMEKRRPTIEEQGRRRLEEMACRTKKATRHQR